MHEQDKLDEATHFLSKMTASLDDPQAFRFELSAFLSAARSVLQYTLEEVKAKTSGQAGYDGRVNGNLVIKFFKDKRDTSIHVKPGIPTTNINIVATEDVRVSDPISIKIIDKDRNVVHASTTASPSLPPTEAHPASGSYSYTFSDWSGAEGHSSMFQIPLGT